VVTLRRYRWECETVLHVGKEPYPFESRTGEAEECRTVRGPTSLPKGPVLIMHSSAIASEPWAVSALTSVPCSRIVWNTEKVCASTVTAHSGGNCQTAKLTSYTAVSDIPAKVGVSAIPWPWVSSGQRHGLTRNFRQAARGVYLAATTERPTQNS
jgi:hypothetical protein